MFNIGVLYSTSEGDALYLVTANVLLKKKKKKQKIVSAGV